MTEHFINIFNDIIYNNLSLYKIIKFYIFKTIFYIPSSPPTEILVSITAVRLFVK